LKALFAEYSMKTIEAISTTEEVNQWLTQSHQLRVLHVFEKACNLINEYGNVLSIVTPSIGNGPFNLVIEKESVDFRNKIEVESGVSIQGDQLIVGNLTIQFAYAKIWGPRPNWEVLHNTREIITAQITPWNIPPLSPAIQQHTSMFSSVIANGDSEIPVNGVRKLAGLGQGLTPSGDDFIMGTMHAAWIIHPPEKALELTSEISDTAEALTTSLSRAWLKSAGNGHAGILWHQFFGALISGNREKVNYTRDKILGIGETSGADALAGFISVFNNWQNLKDKELIDNENSSN